MAEQKDTPGLVNWTGYLSLAALLILPVSVLAARTGAWQPALLLYAIAILGSGMLIIISVISLLLPRYAAWRRNICLNLLFAFPGTLLLLSLLGNGNAPAIHDISTDTANPPVFTMAAQFRGEDANTLDIKADSIAQQKEAYPELKTLHSDLSLQDAFNRSLQVARKLDWEIYHEDPAAGIIEAVDSTRFMGFKDDIVIRLQGDSSGTRIDLRSVSRVGKGDVGANAQRIRAFIELYQQQ